MREPSKKPSIEGVDLAIPLDRELMKTSKVPTCFGKMWDITEKDCTQCADKDTCGILFRDTLNKKSDKIQSKLGTTFLNVADYPNVTTPKLLDFIKGGDITTSELVGYVKRLSNCDDTKAAVEFLKRWITSTKLVYTKNGNVCLK